MTGALRDLIRNPTTAELELIARYAAFKEDVRRERLFGAFASSGLPHRRLEAWKWTDFKQAIASLDEPPDVQDRTDPLEHPGVSVVRFTRSGCTLPENLPPGLRVVAQPAVQAFSGAEDAPMGALAAALSGGKNSPGTLLIEVSGDEPLAVHIAHTAGGAAHFARIAVLLRPGARLDLSESYLCGAALTSVLTEFTVQDGAVLRRTVFQRGGGEAVAITATAHLDAGAQLEQTTLTLGARLARLETRVVHAGIAAKATINAAYLAGPARHADITTHVRHGAVGCTTRQLTKGAVMAGGRGVFQGKFHVPRNTGQHTDAAMQHNCLLLEEGAEAFAKPELEIHADDVQCAHGNTCGALDPAQVFYMRQRGIPEAEARALLTEAFIAEALSGSPHEEALRGIAASWLAS